MTPTFKQFLAEMDFAMDPKKLTPARATYPKTNLKRFMDDWNDKMGAWVLQAERSGAHVKKRVSGNSDATIYDKIGEDDALQSTLVVTGGDATKSGDFTFDFYNHTADNNNKYSVIPSRTEYDEEWTFKPMTGENFHHSDQRNHFTQSEPSRTMADSRRKDGESLNDIVSSHRRRG